MRAAAGSAVKDQLAVAGFRKEGLPLGAGAGEVAQGHEQGPGGDTTGPFAGLAHVDQQDLAGVERGLQASEGTR